MSSSAASSGIKRKLKLKRGTGGSSSSKALTAKQLIAKAHSCLDELPPNIDGAIALFETAVKSHPDSTLVLDAFGAFLCEEGDPDRAAELLQRSVSLKPDAGYNKYFYLAQMAAGSEALDYYQRGSAILSKQIEESSKSESSSSSTVVAEKNKMASVQASIAELYMTELCDEDDAEERCETALKLGFEADPTCLELLVAKLNLLKVQGCVEEAKKIGLSCLSQLKDAIASESPDANVPSDEVRIALSRGLLDLGLIEEGRGILLEMLEQDEEDIQVWYLLACSHLVEQDRRACEECADRGLALCKQTGVEEFKEPLADVLAQAAKLQLKDDANADGADDVEE